MTKTDLTSAICNAFENLSNLSAQVYDYWISELYDVEGNMIAEAWNDQNLQLMENDVMQLTQVDDSYIMENDYAD